MYRLPLNVKDSSAGSNSAPIVFNDSSIWFLTVSISSSILTNTSSFSWIALIILPACASVVFAPKPSSLFAKSKDIFITHGGRLNSEGCHNDKKNNSYHCHNKNSQSDKLESNKKNVIIESCYDGDTCTTSEGEKIRLACIDTAELRGPKAQPVKAQAAKDYLNNLIAGKEVFIKRINW